MTPPGSVYLAALLRTFANTCRRRTKSPRMKMSFGTYSDGEGVLLLVEEWLRRADDGLVEQFCELHGRHAKLDATAHRDS